MPAQGAPHLLMPLQLVHPTSQTRCLEAPTDTPVQSCGRYRVGLSFYRVSVAVNTQGDPYVPVTSAPQRGLMCLCSVAWGAVDSHSAGE